MKLKTIYFNAIVGIVFFIFLMVSCKNEKDVSLLKQDSIDFVNKVYPLLDTENSRWFFFSSANRPFGMVNLSPDTKIKGAWGSGYHYKTDTIKGFSHIHAWQMSGLSIMPITVSKQNQTNIFTDFYSKFSHSKEKVMPGYHYLELDRYNIKAELTSTKRVGFHRYKYDDPKNKALLFNLNTVLGPCENIDGTIEKNSNKELSGKLVMKQTSRRPKPLTVYFKIIFNTPISSIVQDSVTKNYLINLNELDEKVLMKVGISYTSVENANINIQEELPDWDFDEVVTASKNEWNDLLGRVKVEGGTEESQRRFYTDLWHALQGRRTISDFNGAYPDNTKEKFRVGHIPLDAFGRPKFNQYNSDSFWGAQWTINTLWGLVYPEIMEDFTHSLMQYYKDGGLLPRGPSGGNYTYVMTGSSSTPFVVSAIQKNIFKSNLEEVYSALKKNHIPDGLMAKAGYEHTTSIGGGLGYYIKNGYVPSPLPDGNFGLHQDGASQTMEYAYQDWTLAQLAKKLNKTEEESYFLNRAKNYKNVFNKRVGWMAPKDIAGKWKVEFDPYQYENGFVESNAAQATWFVPHDILGLSDLMGGKEKAIEKLNQQFQTAQKLGFTSGNSHEAELHPEYSRIPINYGNQPSIQTAFVFHLLERPDLTQYWSRKVVDSVFSNLSPARGYNGDEDQGLMGSLAVLMKIGLFQMNGGTEENPEYQIGSPIFSRVTIKLNKAYYPGDTFEIRSINNNSKNVYVTDIYFNEKPLRTFKISHQDITNGGILELKMSSKSNFDNAE
tara:strand:- start:41859 stop:44192 length:2334 start_codon:yes stop_codon:yes gene_type:complete